MGVSFFIKCTSFSSGEINIKSKHQLICDYIPLCSLIIYKVRKPEDRTGRHVFWKRNFTLCSTYRQTWVWKRNVTLCLTFSVTVVCLHICCYFGIVIVPRDLMLPPMLHFSRKLNNPQNQLPTTEHPQT